MALFDNSNIKLDVLKKRAFNYRWAEVPDGVIPLTAADPDYPVAPEIQEAMMDYVKDGYFSYTPKLGYPEFKDSISKALMERKGEEIWLRKKWENALPQEMKILHSGTQM